MLIYGHSALVLKLILVLWICENARVRSSHLRGGIIMVRPQPGDNNSVSRNYSQTYILYSVLCNHVCSIHMYY